jgi:hypothetical protein
VPLVRFRAPATRAHTSHLRLLAPSGTRGRTPQPARLTPGQRPRFASASGVGAASKDALTARAGRPGSAGLLPQTRGVGQFPRDSRLRGNGRGSTGGPLRIRVASTAPGRGASSRRPARAGQSAKYWTGPKLARIWQRLPRTVGSPRGRGPKVGLQHSGTSAAWVPPAVGAEVPGLAPEPPPAQQRNADTDAALSAAPDGEGPPGSRKYHRRYQL